MGGWTERFSDAANPGSLVDWRDRFGEKLDEKLDECFKFFTMEDLGNLPLILKISPLIA